MNRDILEFDSCSLYEIGTNLDGLMRKIVSLPYGEYDIDSIDSVPYIKIVELLLSFQLTINKKITLVQHENRYYVRLINFQEYIKSNMNL